MTIAQESFSCMFINTDGLQGGRPTVVCHSLHTYVQLLVVKAAFITYIFMSLSSQFRIDIANLVTSWIMWASSVFRVSYYPGKGTALSNVDVQRHPSQATISLRTPFPAWQRNDQRRPNAADSLVLQRYSIWTWRQFSNWRGAATINCCRLAEFNHTELDILSRL